MLVRRYARSFFQGEYDVTYPFSKCMSSLISWTMYRDTHHPNCSNECRHSYTSLFCFFFFRLFPNTNCIPLFFTMYCFCYTGEKCPTLNRWQSTTQCLSSEPGESGLSLFHPLRQNRAGGQERVVRGCRDSKSCPRRVQLLLRPYFVLVVAKSFNLK